MCDCQKRPVNPKLVIALAVVAVVYAVVKFFGKDIVEIYKVIKANKKKVLE